ncbi:MAG: TonB-dependent receptor [Akkermansia sp.]
MIYYKKALQMGAIAVGLTVFTAGQSSFAAIAKKQAVIKPIKTTQPAQIAKPVDTEEFAILPELTVASHLVGVPYHQTGVSVSVIDVAQMQQRGVETMSGALAKTPGVYMLGGGSLSQRGSVGQMVVRGIGGRSSSSLLVDGMRVSDDMNMVGTGPEDFYGLTELFTLGGLEIVKGPQGAIYGGNSTGSIVSMTTPSGEGTPSLRIFSEAGSHDSYTGYFTSQGKIKKLGYFVGVGYETTQNNPKIVGPNSANGNNDFKQWNEALRLSYDVTEDVKLNMTYRRTDSNFEQPYAIWSPDYSHVTGVDSDTMKLRSNMLTTSVDAKINELWSTSLMLGYYDRHYQDAPPSYDPSNYDHSKVQIDWRNALTWNKEWKTIAGVEWDRSQLEGAWLNKQMESKLAFFVEQLWAPNDSLDFSLAARMEHDNVWNNNFTWRYSNSWKVTGKNSPTRIIGSLGSGFRAPTDFEKYANYTQGWSPYVGNPDLNISRSLGGDLGVEQRLNDSHYVTLTGFWTRINNMIQSQYVKTGEWSGYNTWENKAYATSVGFEVAFKGEFKDAWKSGYNASYTYAMPRDSDGHQLMNTARHTMNAELYTTPIENVTTGIGLTAGLNRTDGFSKSDPKLDDFMTMRWFVRYKMTEHVTLHLRVENIFNQKYVMTKSGNVPGEFLAWGAAVFGGVTMDF